MHSRIKPTLLCLLAVILISVLAVEAEIWFGVDLSAIRLGMTSAIIGLYCGWFVSKIRVNPRPIGRGYKRKPRSGSILVWSDSAHTLSVFR